MKTKALITILVLNLFAAPLALASAGEVAEAQTKGNKGQGEVKGVDSEDIPATRSAVKKVKPTPTAKPQVQTTCDKNYAWNNHGEYVSCVARLHLGGETTSLAAKSDIGKKQESTKSATVSAEKQVKKTEKKLNWLRKWLGKHEEATKEATTSAKFKGDRVEILIYKLESLIEKLTHLLDFLKSK